MRRLTLVWSVVLLSLALSVTIVPAAHAAFPGGNGDIAFSRATTARPTSGSSAPGITGTTPAHEHAAPARRHAGLQRRRHADRLLAVRRGRLLELRHLDDGCRRGRQDAAHVHARRQETWPTWSPDGTQIAYTSDADDAVAGHLGDGRGRRQPDAAHVHGRVRRVPGVVARRHEDRVHERPRRPRRHLGDRRRRLQPDPAHQPARGSTSGRTGRRTARGSRSRAAATSGR